MTAKQSRSGRDRDRKTVEVDETVAAKNNTSERAQKPKSSSSFALTACSLAAAAGSNARSKKPRSRLLQGAAPRKEGDICRSYVLRFEWSTASLQPEGVDGPGMFTQFFYWTKVWCSWIELRNWLRDPRVVRYLFLGELLTLKNIGTVASQLL